MPATSLQPHSSPLRHLELIHLDLAMLTLLQHKEHKRWRQLTLLHKALLNHSP
mgnify:CR=1 FL=1